MYRWLVVAFALAPNAACVATSQQIRAVSVANVEPAPTDTQLPSSLEATSDTQVNTASWHIEDWRLDIDEMMDGDSVRWRAPSPPQPLTPNFSVLTTQPIAGARSSGYGWRDDPFRHTRRFHSGADFPSKSGTPVAAAGDGVVTFAGRANGYGNMVVIDHGGGVATLYGHLRRIEIERNASVAAGEHIGQVGKTGRATGPHLHFEIRVDGTPVDPVAAMAVAQSERSSPGDSTFAALAPTRDVAPNRRVESGHHSRAKTAVHSVRRHGKRPQALW